MESIGFPISREAACCGVYIYLSTTKVGLKSKEELRSDFLRMYEDNYKVGLEKRRRKMLQQRARVEETTSPAGVSDTATVNSFLSMVSSLPKSTVQSPKEGIIWGNDSEDELIAFEGSSNNDVEWVSSGTELFSVVVSVRDPVVEVTQEASDWYEEPEEFWEDDEEDTWVPEQDEDELNNEYPPAEEIIWDDPIDEDGLWEPEEDEVVVSSEPTVSVSQVSKPVAPSVEPDPVACNIKPKTFSEVKTASKPNIEPTVTYSRLDENAIRDFVKSHKLCTESDIFSAFSMYDRSKVRSVIQSALRKYKIFEKHGKFTV